MVTHVTPDCVHDVVRTGCGLHRSGAAVGAPSARATNTSSTADTKVSSRTPVPASVTATAADISRLRRYAAEFLPLWARSCSHSIHPRAGTPAPSGPTAAPGRVRRLAD